MHRYCRLFLPSFSQFFQPFEVAQTLKKSGRPHELRQGRARRTDGHFCPFTAVFLACFPVLCRYGQARAKIIPQAKRNARKKFFQNCAYFGLASTAGLCGVVTVPCGLSKKFRVIASRCFGCFCFGFVRFFFRFFWLLLLCFVCFALVWSLGLVPLPLLHGLLDVVLEALLQIGADQFLDRFRGLAAYHLRHG